MLGERELVVVTSIAKRDTGVVHDLGILRRAPGVRQMPTPAWHREVSGMAVSQSMDDLWEARPMGGQRFLQT